MLLLLKLPAFLLAVYVMYWSLPLSNLLLFIKAWKVVGDRNDIFRWCQFLVRAFGIRVRKCGKQELYRGDACMYLSNHRSWADFFVDCYLTEGRGQLMSRCAAPLQQRKACTGGHGDAPTIQHVEQLCC
eukprot:GHRQ01040269.1.p1 GENE.GHRQ01040269.1~~GHRQ01040269.1.p1  ORF type:complete len:129 (+),score=10.95 GHRQ01040269.1:369-755(+)